MANVLLLASLSRTCKYNDPCTSFFLLMLGLGEGNCDESNKEWMLCNFRGPLHKWKLLEWNAEKFLQFYVAKPIKLDSFRCQFWSKVYGKIWGKSSRNPLESCVNKLSLYELWFWNSKVVVTRCGNHLCFTLPFSWRINLKAEYRCTFCISFCIFLSGTNLWPDVRCGNPCRWHPGEQA